MNQKTIEAYNHYKELYPRALILFHLEGRYVALQDDAGMVSTYLPTLSSFESPYHTSVAIAEDDLIEAMIALGEMDVGCRIVDYRNDHGELDYPDIRRLKQEKLDDY